MKISERLAVLANFVPQGARFADIGTDHGYLPIHLVENNIVDFAVAGDVHSGPFQAAKDAVEKKHLADKIAVRLGNGLMVVAPNEVDTVVIAGMGGNTMVDILNASKQVVSNLSRLILQPMIAAATVRRWLQLNKWNIIDEALVLEDGKLYEVIIAEPGEFPEVEAILYDIGPVLWKKKPNLIQLHLKQLIGQSRRVLQEMSASSSAKNSAKYHEYEEKLHQLEAKLQCL